MYVCGRAAAGVYYRLKIGANLREGMRRNFPPPQKCRLTATAKILCTMPRYENIPFELALVLSGNVVMEWLTQ